MMMAIVMGREDGVYGRGETGGGGGRGREEREMGMEEGRGGEGKGATGICRSGGERSLYSLKR